MEKEAPRFLLRTEDNGTGTPFYARLFLFVLLLRDKMLSSSEDKLGFDEKYASFIEPAKLAYLSFRKLVKLHNEYVEELASGSVISARQQTIAVDKTIDSDVRSLTNTILSEAEIAFKGYINEFIKLFDGIQLGFLAQKDKTYQLEIEKLRSNDALLADYLYKNREAWMSSLNSARNRKEHAGWQLPRYQFTYNKMTNQIEIIPPQIDGMMYLDFLANILSSLFTFAEELTVHLLSVNLQFHYVYQIPLGERKKENAARFATCFITDTAHEPWELVYTGPDYTLIS